MAGELHGELDALHAYRACLNMGTLVGAPKVRAMQLLRQYEDGYRGSYGGAIGILDSAGNLDTSIVIRSAEVREGIARVGQAPAWCWIRIHGWRPRKPATRRWRC